MAECADQSTFFLVTIQAERLPDFWSLDPIFEAVLSPTVRVYDKSNTVFVDIPRRWKGKRPKKIYQRKGQECCADRAHDQLIESSRGFHNAGFPAQQQRQDRPRDEKYP